MVAQSAMRRATARQIAAIHADAKRLGIDDASRRDLMQSVSGKRSAAELTEPEAEAVIRRMKGLGGRPISAVAAGRRPSQTATGKYAPLLRALWLDAWNLGVAGSPDDTALIAFVQRQTKVEHTRFLTDWADALPAIEGLKGWISRVAGVTWPSERDAMAVKVEILRAQLARLGALGGKLPRASSTNPATAERDIHRAQQALGKRIRAALAKKEAANG